MVPRLTSGGRSFKGAALYYLHDKLQEGEKVRLTTERVAWTETRNLPTEDPERAWRMMVHTASQQAALKAASGIKATGRKLENPVLAYSLSWHPEEKPDRAEMLRAADESLKILGLEQHQAVLIAHHDEPHPHVHVIVNRVDPNDGRAAPLSKSKLALSKWAEDYERRQGLIRCEERVKNNAHRDMRQGFDRAAADKTPRRDFRRAANENRKAYEARRSAAQASRTNRQREQAIRLAQLAKDRALSERSKAIYAGHRRQWSALQKSYKDQKAGIARQREAAVAAAIDAAKAAQKGNWRAFYAQQRKDERAFWRREQSTLGRAWNTLRLVADTPVSQQGKEHRGHLSRAFNIIVSQKGRHEALKAVHESDKRQRAGLAMASIRDIAKAARDGFKAHYRQGWDNFQQQRDALLQAQTADREAIRQAWKDLRAEKAQEWDSFRETGLKEAAQEREQAEALQQRRDAATSRVRASFGRSADESRDRDDGSRQRPSPGSTPPPQKPGGGRF